MAEVAPGVHLIDGLNGGPRTPNVYLLADQSLALVDAGFPGNLNGIRRYIESVGRRLEELRYILITHSHPDHTGGAAALRARTGAQILAHPADVKPTRNGSSVCYMGVFGASPLSLPFLRRVPADGLLKDGAELPMLGGLKVFHTPGHTPGSACFHLPQRGVLFCGDLLVEHQGSIRKNRAFPGSDLESYQASLARIGALEYEKLCPGHGNPIEVNAASRVRELVQSPEYGFTWKLLG